MSSPVFSGSNIDTLVDFHSASINGAPSFLISGCSFVPPTNIEGILIAISVNFKTKKIRNFIILIFF